MIALNILDIKNFMNSLLNTDIFDNFLVSSFSVTTYVTLNIDGRYFKEYFSEEEAMDCHIATEITSRNDVVESGNTNTLVSYSQIRALCFNFIKGKNKPLNILANFKLNKENQNNTVLKSGTNFKENDVSSLNLQIKYSENKLTCITGIAYNTFTMDKSLDEYFDMSIEKFLKSKGIAFERL